MCGGAQKDVIAVFMWATWDVYISLISLSLLRHQLRTKNPLSPCLCQRKTTICLTYVWRRSKKTSQLMWARVGEAPLKRCIYRSSCSLFFSRHWKSKVYLLPCQVCKKQRYAWVMCGGAQKGCSSTRMCGVEVFPPNKCMSPISLSTSINQKPKVHPFPCHVRQNHPLHWPMCGAA